MRITTLHEAASIDAVVDRMFTGISAKDRGKVTAALIKANPALEGQDRLDPGTVLVIPALAGVKAPPSLSSSEFSDPVGETADWVRRAVTDYATRLTLRHNEYQEQLKQQAALLKDREFTAALRQRPDAAELVPGIQAGIKARGKDATASLKEFQDVVRTVTESLGSS